MASGTTLVVLTAAHALPDSTAAPGISNDAEVRVFDGGTNETAVFETILPQTYNGSGIDVILHMAMAATTTGDLDMDTAFAKVTNATDSYATAVSQDGEAIPGTALDTFKVTSAHTDGAQLDSIAKGDLFRLKVTRDAVADTNTGEMYLLAVELQET